MTKSTGVGRGNNPRSHGNTKRGVEHHRWNNDRMLSDEGYVKVRVGVDHPLADPNGYTYEHLLVWCSAGRARPAEGETLHHRNEVKTDNRLDNLELLNRVSHAAEHQGDRMLSDEEVRSLRVRYASGEDGTVLAEVFGIPMQRAYKIIKGQTRRDAGGPIQSGSLRGRKRP